jgi:endoglucanase
VKSPVRALVLVATLVLSAAVASGGTTAASTVGRSATAPGNPLAGHRMGVYKGPGELAWAPYERATGQRKALLGKIALRPKMRWFGQWTGSGAELARKVRTYIAVSTGGDPDVLSQMAIFRMKPWEHDACKRLPTRAEKVAYRQWINTFAAAVGDARTAIVLQPDGPFVLCAPHGSKVPAHLIRYAARRLSQLPNTSVYIDGGAADWPRYHPEVSAQFLIDDGIEFVRGFALNSTHYVAVEDDIAFGTQVVAELAKRGVRGKHFVINTSSNGRGFNFGDARGSHPDNAKVCATTTERTCVTLGIPPTTDVADHRWGLSPKRATQAAAHVDAYLWIGRPWLFMQADPFVASRALAMARTTPW